MSTLRFAEQVRVELDDLWFGIAQHNPAAADRFIDELCDTCSLLSENPLMGRSREEWRPRLRSFQHGRFLILYRPLDDGVEVAHVVHGRRDMAALLEGNDF
jgi:toxin ParE1/3/4